VEINYNREWQSMHALSIERHDNVVIAIVVVVNVTGELSISWIRSALAGCESLARIINSVITKAKRANE